MRERQELRSFAAVMLVITVVCVTIMASCGSGEKGEGNGELCSQCGDTDGPCLELFEVTGDDRPDFCTGDPCTVELRCLRKLDSSQRRCFPADPATNELDTDYRCDGARPNPSIFPTTTATPSATVTPSPSLTPSATGLTPTPTTTTSSPVPTSTAAVEEEAAVTITINDPSAAFADGFSATVTYPATKGTFDDAEGALDCASDEEITLQDDGNGTLTLSFSGDSTDFFPLGTDCTFHLNAGETLSTGELGKTVSPSPLTIAVEVDS